MISKIGKNICNVKKLDDALIGSIFNCELDNLNVLYINKYLWIENNYEPKVEVRLAYSRKYIFVAYKVFEKEITATYTEINSPVYKDSCVEFFVNLFPLKSDMYFNFEINAIGTLYAAFGSVYERKILPDEDIAKILIVSTFTKPFKGKIDEEFWELKLAIPFELLLSRYGEDEIDKTAIANFYKCGDETTYKHYGVWSEIFNEKPNFHLPQFFGKLVFE